jgi:hypothetical protein
LAEDRPIPVLYLALILKIIQMVTMPFEYKPAQSVKPGQIADKEHRAFVLPGKRRAHDREYNSNGESHNNSFATLG